MIGLSNPKLRNQFARLSRLSYIVVAFAVAFVGLTMAGVGFGFVFNFKKENGLNIERVRFRYLKALWCAVEC